MPNKQFYDEFAAHAFRFYARNPVVAHCDLSAADLANWEACDAVYRESNSISRDIIMGVFASKAPMAESVATISKRIKVNENVVWRAISRAQRSFAQKRGLV